MHASEFRRLSEFTGERVVPGLVDIDLFNEHLSRYQFARKFAADKRVLDVGCGSGYGAAVMATLAAEITAIDASGEAIAYARDHYADPKIRFFEGLAASLPDGPFDLITTFEVIEHLDDWRGFLHEAMRVLAPGGLFLVSTPNQIYYAESRGASGANPFHVHEFEFAEFHQELQGVFPHVAMLLQNHAEGVAFVPVAGAQHAAADFGPHRISPDDAHFFVAMCGREPFSSPTAFVWIPSDANLLRERERHIELQAGEIRMKTQWLAERKAELDARNAEYDELLSRVRELNAELERRNEWALACQAEADRRGRVALEQQEEFARETAKFQEVASAYESKLAELEDINFTKTAWAIETERRLSAEIAERTRELTECIEILHSAERIVDERTAWAQSLDREVAAWQQRYGALRGSQWVRIGSRLKLVDPR